MAQVLERIWRSGPRKVKRTAWGYTVQLHGKQERKFNAGWSKQDAEDALAARLLDRDVPPTPPAASVLTFKAMTERYLREKEAGRKKTIQTDREVLARFLDVFGAATPLVEITASRIAEYRVMRLTTISPRTGRRLEPGTVNRELSILRGLLRMAADAECGYLERAPRVRMEKEPQGRLRFLSEDEARRLLAECRRAAEHPVSSCRSPYLYAVVAVALATGMRRGEVLGLEWSRVNFSRGVIQLEETKTGKRREVPLNRGSYDALADLRRQQGGAPVGRVFRGVTVRTAFLSAVERAQIPNFTFHGLRHTCASWLVMRGRPLKAVQELLGHTSIRMTERYAHLSPDRLREDVATLDDFFSTTSAHGASAEALAPVSTR
jgi:integrase